MAASNSPADLLIEVGTEEIPAGYVEPALAWLAESLSSALTGAGLAEGEPRIQTFATPRRLAIHARGVRSSRPEERTERTGPRRSACFDAKGEPTRALQGFARGAGVDPGDVAFKEVEGKGEVACAEVIIPGQQASELLPGIVVDLLVRLPFPKSMRWSRQREHTFCRPVRSLVVLLGDEVVEATFADVTSGREVHGHPFLDGSTAILASANLETYRATLEAARVQLSSEERRATVRAAIAALDLGAQGLTADVDEDLLAEVANLVEWPGVQVGEFDAKFLELPEPVLIEPMKVQQRYFPVRRQADGKLANRFIVVHNRGGAGADSPIARGNARVLRARLSDARFFFDNDLQRPLETLLPRLEGVLFRKGQGSVRQKCGRVSVLAALIADALAKAADWSDVESARVGQGWGGRAARAGLLAKADLVSEMVYEFPELQGTMGSIYAERQGEPQEVVAALGAQYGPRITDPVPTAPVDVAVCLADKLDNLASATLADALARGNRDPFASRRDAIAVLRILYEGRTPLRLDQLVTDAGAGYREIVDGGWRTEHQEMLLEFLRDRLAAYIRDADHDHELVAAALATDAADLAGLRLRLEALEELARSELWPVLVEAVERTFNITKSWEIPAAWGDELRVDPELLVEDEERELHAVAEQVFSAFRSHVEGGDLQAASKLYAERLAEPLARYFEKVFVNHDDPAVRDNRMAQLRGIHRLYASSIADLSLVNLKRERA